MRYFYDTEFLDDGSTIELISIGIVAEDGREYYAVNAHLNTVRIGGHDWLVKNVVPHLPLHDGDTIRQHITKATDTGLKFNPPHHRLHWRLDHNHPAVKPRAVIADQVRDFLRAGDDTPELWAYFCAYDHVALAQLWGPMTTLPHGIPMWTHDLMQLWEQAGRPPKPPKPDNAHDALADARWNLALHQVCTDALTS